MGRKAHRSAASWPFSRTCMRAVGVAVCVPPSAVLSDRAAAAWTPFDPRPAVPSASVRASYPLPSLPGPPRTGCCRTDPWRMALAGWKEGTRLAAGCRAPGQARRDGNEARWRQDAPQPRSVPVRACSFAAPVCTAVLLCCVLFRPSAERTEPAARIGCNDTAGQPHAAACAQHA